MNKFEKLGLNNEILRRIKQKGFTEPTYIQEQSIPAILKGEDVVGKSATGSGKTLAFGAGLMQNLGNHGLQGLVLTPTRELAEQVSEFLKEFSGLRIISVYGGVGINPQIKALERANIVVGTPGRILDHMERGTIDFRQIKIVVLDEADRMLDMGFVDDVRKIVRQTPRQRQTMLFSATISSDIKNLQDEFMNNPKTVKVQDQVDPSKLTQQYYDVKPREKLSLLVTLLKRDDSNSVMVFCNTRKMVDDLAKNLNKNGLEAFPIHGGFTQAKRNQKMNQFKKKQAILVCSDVAARGLDIKEVSHVYNYDIPRDSKDYIHRIGRTARAGEEGKAVNILAPRDHENFSRIMNDYRELKIHKVKVPELDQVHFVTVNTGRKFGQRNQGNRHRRQKQRRRY